MCDNQNHGKHLGINLAVVGVVHAILMALARHQEVREELSGFIADLYPLVDPGTEEFSGYRDTLATLSGALDIHQSKEKLRPDWITVIRGGKSGGSNDDHD